MIATTEFVVNNGTPTGALMMWTTASAPSGWLLCNGAAISRTTYATLFAVIGTTFGLGNGSSTFNLPDYRDRMPIGAGTSYAVAGTGGSKDAVVVSHTHTLTDPGHTHSAQVIGSLSGGGGLEEGAGAPNYQLTSVASNVTGISVNSAGTSGTNANLPPYMGIQFIIKT